MISWQVPEPLLGMHACKACFIELSLTREFCPDLLSAGMQGCAQQTREVCWAFVPDLFGQQSLCYRCDHSGG